MSENSYCRWIWPGWLIRLMREELMHAFCQVYRSLLWILDDEHIYKEESSPCLSSNVSFLGCCVILSYNSIHHHPWQKSLRLHQPKITRDCVFMNSLFYVTIPSIVFDDFFSILIIMRLRHNQKRKKHLAPHGLKFPRRFTLRYSSGWNLLQQNHSYYISFESSWHQAAKIIAFFVLRQMTQRCGS